MGWQGGRVSSGEAGVGRVVGPGCPMCPEYAPYGVRSRPGGGDPYVVKECWEGKRTLRVRTFGRYAPTPDAG